MITIINDKNSTFNALCSGIKTVAELVEVTYGPKGKLVMIKNENDVYPHPTKDGVTVARSVNLLNPIENIGANLIKEVAEKTLKNVGDGTTTSIILTNKLLENYKSYSNIVKQDIDELYSNILNDIQEKFIEYLKVNKRAVKTPDIYNIAKISSNGDNTISSVISDIYAELGLYAKVIIDDSLYDKTNVIIKKGFNVDNGYFSKFNTNLINTNIIELENADIVILDDKIIDGKIINDIAKCTNNPNVVIFANDMDKQAIKAFTNFNETYDTNYIVVKNPRFGDTRTEMQIDLSCYVDNHVVKNINEINKNNIGHSTKVIISDNQTFISNDNYMPNEIQDRIDYINKQLEDTKAEYIKETLIERLSNIQGGVAVIQIKASTDSEYKEIKDRYDDALCAVVSSIKNGIVQGGGRFLYNFVNYLKQQDVNNHYVYNVFNTPYIILKPNINNDEDYFIEGIVDPADVVLNVVKNAISITNIIINTNAVIYN